MTDPMTNNPEERLRNRIDKYENELKVCNIKAPNCHRCVELPNIIRDLKEDLQDTIDWQQSQGQKEVKSAEEILIECLKKELNGRDLNSPAVIAYLRKEQHEAALKAMEAYASQFKSSQENDGWIRVEDEPEEYQDCLIFRSDKVFPIQMYHYSGAFPIDATHWRPLPAPPSQTSKQKR